MSDSHSALRRKIREEVLAEIEAECAAMPPDEDDWRYLPDLPEVVVRWGISENVLVAKVGVGGESEVEEAWLTKDGDWLSGEGCYSLVGVYAWRPMPKPPPRQGAS